MSLTPNTDEMASVVDVSLILKGKSKKTIKSWRELQTELVPVKKSCKNDKFIEDCKFCLGSHSLPKEADQIDTLRFMDLTEVNKQIFN